MNTEDHDLVRLSLASSTEILEAENTRLQGCLADREGKRAPFGIEQIKHDDHLVSFYTGFSSYEIFIAFFQFLGPAVNKLNYWGCSAETRKRQCSMTLTPVNQLLMTLVKLRLNLKVFDLAFRFGASSATVSRYITTYRRTCRYASCTIT